jgi:excisionase family DNA binding protein
MCVAQLRLGDDTPKSGKKRTVPLPSGVVEAPQAQVEGRSLAVSERMARLSREGRAVTVNLEELPLALSETTPFLVSVTEAAKLLGWGRTKLYHAIQRGYFTAGVVHVGTSISISRRALFRWLETVGDTGAPPTSTR